MIKTRAVPSTLAALAIICFPVFAQRGAGEAPPSAPLLPILIVLLVVGLLAFGVYKLLSVKDRRADQVELSVEAVDPKLVGIGGWLVLPAIGLVLGPAFAGILLIAGLREPVLEIASYGGLGDIFALELVLIIGLIVLAVYAATLFFRRRWNAPRTVIVLLVVGLVVSGVLVAFGFVAGPQVLRLIFGILAVGAAIWIPYFRVSKRVQATFVNGKAERLESNRKADNQDLVGIRGWLILPAIGLVLGPAIGAVELIAGITMYPNVAKAGYGGVYAMNLLMVTGLVVFAAYAAMLFFRKSSNAPRTVIALLIAGLVASGALVAIGVGAGADLFAAANGRHLVFEIIGASIWIPYFRVSKRVKATFVR